MAAEANLGRWEAREVESVPIATPARARTLGREPSQAAPGDGDDSSESTGGSGSGDEPGRRRDGAGLPFWLGVLVGLVPLVILVAGLLGSRLTSDDTSSEEGSAIAAVDAVASPASEPTTPTTPTTDLTVRTAPAPTTTAPSSTALEATLPLVADGVVTDGAIEVRGVLVDQHRTRWVGELADLAAVMGYRLDDRTEGVGGGSVAATELLVRFPGAVVFQPDSPRSFDGAVQPVFEAIAGVLNRGSADLHIVAYAEPGDADRATLAQARAEHVGEHLAELGVQRGRLTVEVRGAEEAPIVAADGSPIERRVDLEFRFRP